MTPIEQLLRDSAEQNRWLEKNVVAIAADPSHGIRAMDEIICKARIQYRKEQELLAMCRRQFRQNLKRFNSADHYLAGVKSDEAKEQIKAAIKMGWHEPHPASDSETNTEGT